MKQAPDPLYFLIFFPLLWFAVTMLLSFLSGWFGLMERSSRPAAACGERSLLGRLVTKYDVGA
jgi:hypothetical protein